MKFLISLFTLLTVTNCIFSQTKKTDIGASPDVKKIIDSTGINKRDSLSYATLYFYRSYIPKMNAPVKKVPIYINDSLIYNLKANNIIGLKVLKEGKYNIAIDTKGETEIPIKVKFGNEYFFKCEVVKGLWFGKPTIELVTPKIGREESGLLKGD